MKKKISILTILVFLSLSIFAAVGSNGSEIFEISSENTHEINLNFAVDNFDIAEETIEGITYQRLEHPNAGYITHRGNPEIPTFSTMIKIPNTGKVELNIIGYDEVDFQDLNLYPSQGTYNADRGPVQFAKNEETYNQDKYFETPIADISSPAILRDHRVVSVTVFPIKYNPVTKETVLRKNIEVTVKFIDEPGINELNQRTSALKSRAFENLYKTSILNYQPTRDVEHYQEKTLVIIYAQGNNDVENIVHHLYEWKREKGFNVVLAGSDITGTSSTSIKAYLQDGYDTWENRPEYILLIGDPTQGSLQVPASGTNGDHHYTEFVGNDYLPDAFVGRLSAETPTQLMTIWNKIKFYEKMPYMAELDWYKTHLLVGDSTPSGTSTYYTNLYIHDVMSDYDSEHTFIELFSGNPSVPEMNTTMSEGANVFNYRGYIGMSGWGVNDASNNVNNGLKLINSVMITCDTGTFTSTYGESRTEAFTRAGTPGSPKGAVSAVGMATSGTNTRFNNALDGGIFHSLYKGGGNTIGQATAYGKVFLHQTYWWDPNHGGPSAFVTWFNQMGDPSMDVWKTQPTALVATYDNSIEKGTNFLDVHVTKVSGVPIENAWVTARQTSDSGFDEILFATGYTNSSGDIRLQFEGEIPGDVKLTVTKPQYIPHLGEFTIEETEMINIETVIIDDDNEGDSSGNDNQEVNSGETIELVLEIKNNLVTAVNNVQAELTTEDTYFTISQAEADYGNIVADGTADGAFVVEVSYACPNEYEGFLTLDLSSDEGDFSSSVFFNIQGTDVEITEMILNDNDNNILDPGEIANIELEIINNGNVNLENVYAELISSNGLLMVNDNISIFGDIAIGQTVDNQTDSFQIQANAQLIPGMIIPFDVQFYNAAGYDEIESFEIMIGSPDINDPTGPDNYGYFLYDDEDVDYLDCPEYDWIEIDPSFGGDGTDTGMTDTGEDQDENVQLTLPFTFNFYGEPHTEIVVCTNGWISFSDTDQNTFRNWLLPGPLGPTRMVAAFWDDLETGSGGVYTQYRPAQHIYVIEWSNMQSRQTGAENTFQIWLYDPNYFPTSQGDGKIKIQYKVVNNDDNAGGGPAWTGGNYCSVGIENATSDVGLQYTFNNEYDANAKPLENEMAIAFSGPPVSFETPYIVLGNQIVIDENGNGIVEAGEHIQLGIRLSNIGEQVAIGTSATISSSTPFATVTNATSEYGPIAGGQSLSGIDYFELDIAETVPDGNTIEFQIDIELGEESWMYIFNFNANSASLEYDNFLVNDSAGNADGIPNNGETVKIGVVLKNDNLVEAQNIIASVSTVSEIATITNSDLLYGNLAGTTQKMAIFELAIDESAEDSTPIDINLSYSADGISQSTEIMTIQVNMSSLFNDFEEDDGEFVGDGLWAWGAGTTAHSGTNVWATNLTGSYGNNADYGLVTPAFLLSSAADLSIWHEHQFESSWDGGNVRISIDGGSSWNLLVPDGGYDGTVYAPASNNEEVFKANSNGWIQDTFDLSDYVGEEITLRFGFYSDGSVTYPGWNIDDVMIGGVSADFGGLVSGTVTIDNDEDVQNVMVSSLDMSTSPAPDGTYEMILSEGTAEVSAFMPFYTATVQDAFTVSMENPQTGIDFSLEHIASPENLTLENPENTYHVMLDWEFANLDDEEFVNFEILRKIDTDIFILIGSTTETHFEQTVQYNDHTYTYYVVANYENGQSDQSNEVSIYIEVDNNDDNAPALVTALYGNYPNPFNPITNISFSLAEPSAVSIEIFNIKGQLVKTLKDEYMDSGNYNIVWNGKDNSDKKVSTGVYFYNMQTDSYHSIKKALLLK